MSEETNSKCACGCSHMPDHGACAQFERGMNGRCVYCDHARGCHPGKGPLANGPLEPTRVDQSLEYLVIVRGPGCDCEVIDLHLQAIYAEKFGDERCDLCKQADRVTMNCPHGSTVREATAADHAAALFGKTAGDDLEDASAQLDDLVAHYSEGDNCQAYQHAAERARDWFFEVARRVREARDSVPPPTFVSKAAELRARGDAAARMGS